LLNAYFFIKQQQPLTSFFSVICGKKYFFDFNKKMQYFQTCLKIVLTFVFFKIEKIKRITVLSSRSSIERHLDKQIHYIPSLGILSFKSLFN